jgi:putative methyltransferase (TIGR04325 family)
MNLKNNYKSVKWAKQVLPPFLWRMLVSLVPRIRWTGNYKNWSEASSKATGYDDIKILESVSTAATLALNGNAAYERDGKLFYTAEPHLPLLAAFSQITAKCHSPVRVVDYGGALGSTFLQNQKWLKNLITEWLIVEQPTYVVRGRDIFRDLSVSFFTSIDEIPGSHAESKVLLHASAVLQYLPDPLGQLESLIAKSKADFIFLDRMPYVLNGPRRLTVQYVPNSINRASYPAWFFAKAEIESLLEATYEQIFTFPAQDLCIDFPAYFEGSFWRRKSS